MADGLCQAPDNRQMEPQKAEVLSDTATDRTKKIRVHLRDKNGRLLVATRTFGKTYSIKLTPLKTAK